MSDDWKFYPRQVGENLASVLFDDGISETIDDAPEFLLRIRVIFKEPRDDGLPTAQECEPLDALDDALGELLERHGGVNVGRITLDGNRDYYIYTPESSAEVWRERIEALSAAHDYPLKLALEADEEHAAYWDVLYPDDVSRQIINDQSVIMALEEAGDDGTAVRRIEHWAVFPTQAAADEFSAWVQAQGYITAEGHSTDDGQIMVHFAHEGTVVPNEIMAHTIEIRQRAADLGGDYDGWETEVRRNDESI